jgi:hypothetical protein
MSTHQENGLKIIAIDNQLYSMLHMILSTREYLYIPPNLTVLPLVLHPSLNLEYFQCQDWEEGWIQVAEELVHKQYASVHKVSNNSPIENFQASEQVILCFMLYSHFHNNSLSLMMSCGLCKLLG